MRKEGKGIRKEGKRKNEGKGTRKERGDITKNEVMWAKVAQ